MAVSFDNFTGDGSTVDFNITFQYQKESDVYVTIDDQLNTAWTLSTATRVTFTDAPEDGAAIKIYRDTNIASMVAVFAPGSAIRARDLNDDFDQLRLAIQENQDYAENNETELDALEARVTVNEANIATNTANIATNAAAIATNASNIATNAANISTNAANIASNAARITQNESDIAANTANFANYFNKGEETIRSDEAWSSTNGKIATTAAINARIDSKITAANPTASFNPTANDAILRLEPGGWNTQITAATTSLAGLLTAADKQKLDRIQFNTRRNTTFTTSFNGTSTDYTLTHKTPNSAFEILLTVGGIIQQPNVDFTYNPTSGVVSFTNPPPKTAPYGITFNSVLTSNVGQATAFDEFLSEEEIQRRLDLAATAVDAMFDQLRVAIDEATDFDTLKARLLAVLQ